MKSVKTDKSAYETFPGLTREEATEKGYVEVENNASGNAPIFGRYLDTETGAALETLRDEDKRVARPAGGQSVLSAQINQKGSLLNVDDPVVHGTGENNPHEDGASPNPARNDDLEVEGYVPEARKPGRPRKAD